MKILTGILIFAASTLHAAPFLVCNSYPAQTNSSLNVVSFVVNGLGTTPITVNATIKSDGSQQLHYDLVALPNGSYTVTAAAVNGFGSESAASAPFSFTSGVPAVPAGLSISPK